MQNLLQNQAAVNAKFAESQPLPSHRWVGEFRGHRVEASISSRKGTRHFFKIRWDPEPDPSQKARYRRTMAAYRLWRATVLEEICKIIGIRSGTLSDHLPHGTEVVRCTIGNIRKGDQ